MKGGCATDSWGMLTTNLTTAGFSPNFTIPYCCRNRTPCHSEGTRGERERERERKKRQSKKKKNQGKKLIELTIKILSAGDHIHAVWAVTRVRKVFALDFLKEQVN